MNTRKLWRLAFGALIVFSLVSCSSDDESAPELIIDPVVELEKPTATTSLTLSNMPVIDGSESTESLRNLLVYRLPPTLLLKTL